MESLHTSFLGPSQYRFNFVVEQNFCGQQLENMAENIPAWAGFASVTKCEKGTASICQGFILA